MMQPSLRLATLALLPAAMLTFTSCSSTGGTETDTVVETKNGVAVVETIKTSAVVTAVDTTSRKVTLKFEGGKSQTVKCGPAVANFGQIRVGDKLTVTITEELAVFLGKGNPPSATVGAGVALAPIGAKPGGMVADTVVVTAKITAVNAKTRKVTLLAADGSTRVISAGQQVDLSSVKPGDDVTVQYTESLAVTMEKP